MSLAARRARSSLVDESRSEITSFVQRRHVDRCGTIDVSDVHVPRLAADLTVLDVPLRASTSGIDRYGNCFAAVGTYNSSGIICRSVPEGKLLIQILPVAIHVQL